MSTVRPRNKLVFYWPHDVSFNYLLEVSLSGHLLGLITVLPAASTCPGIDVVKVGILLFVSEKNQSTDDIATDRSSPEWQQVWM